MIGLAVVYASLIEAALKWWRDYRIKREAREGADHLIACYDRRELDEFATATSGLDRGPLDTKSAGTSMRSRGITRGSDAET